ncbi:hypothetical protein ACE01U_06035 [Acinetobacter sp. BSP-153]|nr:MULTISPECIES: hypothetical protein [unclassified Acinetobacter]
MNQYKGFGDLCSRGYAPQAAFLANPIYILMGHSGLTKVVVEL